MLRCGLPEPAVRPVAQHFCRLVGRTADFAAFHEIEMNGCSRERVVGEMSVP